MSDDKISTQAKSGVRCIEVLISKESLRSTNVDLSWTLSVYSLENRPVELAHALPDAEVFHFMVYDWRKTIEKLLNEHNISYNILQFFRTKTIYPDTVASASERSDSLHEFSTDKKLDFFHQ